MKPSARRHFPTDAAEPDDEERAAAKIVAEERVVPTTARHDVDRLAEPARGHHDQRQRQVGDGIAQHRGVRDGDRTPGRFAHVDVIEPDADGAQHAQPGCPREQTRVGSHVRIDEQAVRVVEELGEVFIARGREVDDLNPGGTESGPLRRTQLDRRDDRRARVARTRHQPRAYRYADVVEPARSGATLCNA